jgi:Skp family chaperone for outer membrane proteins
MFSRRSLPILFGLLLSTAVSVQAQDSVRIASCNPSKVFAALDERKVIQDKINSEIQKFQGETQKRKVEFESLKQERDNLKPESSTYNEKQTQLLNKSVEFDVWSRIQQQEIVRHEKEYTKSLFDKIRQACEEVAKERKIDMVLAERRPELSQEDWEKLTPEQARNLLGQTDTLYINEKADITQAVILLMNKKFAESQTGKK